MTTQQAAKQLREIAKALAKIAESLTEKDDPGPVFPERRMEDYENDICLVCGKRIDATEVSNRGLHNKCYKQVMKGIKDKEYTESQAISLGRIYYPQKAGRKPSSVVKSISQEAQEAASPVEGKAKPKRKPAT